MPNITHRCTVLVNFNDRHTSVLEEEFGKDSSVFVTNNKSIEMHLTSKGFNAKYLGNYFEDGSQLLVAVQNEAVRKVAAIKELIFDIEFQDIRLMEGLKLIVLEDLIFLEKIKHVLKQAENYVFLFDNLLYRYFSINKLAQVLGYDISFPLSISDRKFKPVEDQLLSNEFKEIFENKLSQEYDSELRNRITATLDSISITNRNARYGFFLVENQEGYYLKPVYPIVEKFIENKQDFILFCFSSRTADQVIRKGYHIYNLSPYIDEIELVVLSRERELVKNIFAKLRNLNDIVLDHYLCTLRNDYIVRAIARTLSVILVIDKITKILQFNSLVVAADGDPDNDIVCAIAEKRGVPTYGVVPFVKEFTPMFKVLYSASKLFISGPRLMKELETIGIEKTRMIVIGSPRYDYLKSRESDLQSNMSLTKTVLIAPSRIYDNDEVWISKCIAFCISSGLRVIVKLHPMYRFRDDLKQSISNKITYINQECKGLEYVISIDEDIAYFLHKASMLVTDYSSVALEASLKELPVIIFTRGKRERSADHFLSFQDEGIALIANNKEELFDSIRQILTDKVVIERLAFRRRTFNFDFNYLNDGKASERAYRILFKDC